MLGNDFFKPRSIAVIGASANPTKIGFSLVKNLLDGKFEGRIYPVNFDETNILGLKCYPKISYIPTEVNLAIISTPAITVPAVLEQCGQRKIKYVIIISAGFAEVGQAGKDLQLAIKQVAEKYKIRVLGPNCLGVISPINRLNASFSLNMPVKKNIAVISQSGAICTAILDWANKKGVGFSHFVSLGNKVDLSENDFLEYFANDPNTEVVIGYLESISDGPNFLKSARELTKKKPFILLKSGRSKEGQKAASSHTAALAEDDLVVTEAMQEAGVIRADNLEDLFEWSMTFSEIVLPINNKAMVITNAGGPAVMTTDEIANRHHLKFFEVSKKLETQLSTNLDKKITINNPLDLLGDATSKEFENFFKTIQTRKEAVPDIKIILLTPQSNTDIEKIAKKIVEYKDNKTVVVFIGGKSFDLAYQILAEAKIPTFLYPESAVRALDQLARYTDYKKLKQQKIHYVKGIKRAAERIIKKDGFLTDSDLAKLLAAYQIPMADSKLANTLDEAMEAANRIGYPVVLKVASPNILHKTEGRVVKLGISTDEELKNGYEEILSNSKKNFPNAQIAGITVYRMVRSSVEFALGAKRDPVFGPIIMFGLGGVYIEVFNDFRIRLAPVSIEEAHEMIKKIKSYELLLGYRNTQKFDLEAIAKAISGLSSLMTDFPKIKEVDVNPIRLAKSNGGILALDAKVIFDSAKLE
ncbi:MAG: acetate--CoA ligase family protein [Patescibacteria group bacterium]|nr:acetate--CoA ligase family protein [Patescibacteria group bacterium]